MYTEDDDDFATGMCWALPISICMWGAIIAVLWWL